MLWNKIKRSKTYFTAAIIMLAILVGSIITNALAFAIPSTVALLYCSYKVASTEY